jgi:hypothetical protein
MKNGATTPVLLLVFNRPDTTQVVFDAIRKARPARLYVAADGPREGRPGEKDLCTSTRATATNVDWPCDVHTLFRDRNLGCKVAVSSALDWFFQHEEEGIILEDDCVPDKSFFTFCQELLSYYRTDQRIMHISGDNFQAGNIRGTGSYYFSRYSHVWGWASWRRAWKCYDVTMSTFPRFIQQDGISSIFHTSREKRYWQRILSEVYEGKVDTWDYQWLYALWTHHGLSAIPNANLVANIGFGPGATHTTTAGRRAVTREVGSLSDLRHPVLLLRDEAADQFTFRSHFQSSLAAKIRHTVTKALR